MKNKLLIIVTTLIAACTTLPAVDTSCSEYQSGDMETTQICHYPGSDLAQTYRQHRNSLDADGQSLLLPSAPLQAQKVRVDERAATVSYRPQRNGLHITQEFEGGITEITFTRRSKDIEVKTVMSAD